MLLKMEAFCCTLNMEKTFKQSHRVLFLYNIHNVIQRDKNRIDYSNILSSIASAPRSDELPILKSPEYLFSDEEYEKGIDKNGRNKCF